MRALRSILGWITTRWVAVRECVGHEEGSIKRDMVKTQNSGFTREVYSGILRCRSGMSALQGGRGDQPLDDAEGADGEDTNREERVSAGKKERLEPLGSRELLRMT